MAAAQDPNVYAQDPNVQQYAEDPNEQQQYAQDPNAQQQYTQDPNAQQQYGQDPNAQQQYGQDPNMQQQYGQDPNAQQQYGQDPNAQQQYGQDPNAQQQYGQDPNAQQQYAHDPNAQQQYGQHPNAQQQYGQHPNAQQHYGQDPNAQQQYGLDPNAQQQYGQDPNAQYVQDPYAQQYGQEPNAPQYPDAQQPHGFREFLDADAAEEHEGPFKLLPHGQHILPAREAHEVGAVTPAEAKVLREPDDSKKLGRPGVSIFVRGDFPGVMIDRKLLAKRPKSPGGMSAVSTFGLRDASSSTTTSSGATLSSWEGGSGEDLAKRLLDEEVARIAKGEGPGEFWGFVNTPRGRKAARKFYIAGEDGLQVTLTNYGARIVSIRMPDVFGMVDEVVIGLDNLSDYEKVRDQRLGCVLGRMSTPLIGKIQEEGYTNFDEMAWDTHLASASHVVFSLHCPAGEQDYPGEVVVTAEYSLQRSNMLLLRLTASCTEPTPLAMSMRLPFNLAGFRSGAPGLAAHHLMINARKFLEADKDKVLTGEVRRCTHHGLGFLAPYHLETAFITAPGGNFDHHLVLNGFPCDGLRFVARLSHEITGRSVEIYSNTQCLHIDSLNDLKPPLPEGEDGEEEGTETEQQGPKTPVVPTPPPYPPYPPGADMSEEEIDGESDFYSETWGELGEGGGDLGEALERPDDMKEEFFIRTPYELTPQGGIVLAPEDYPDTIFEKKNQYTLQPGQLYERLVRFAFTTSVLPTLPLPASAAARVAAVTALHHALGKATGAKRLSGAMAAGEVLGAAVMAAAATAGQKPGNVVGHAGDGYRGPRFAQPGQAQPGQSQYAQGQPPQARFAQGQPGQSQFAQGQPPQAQFAQGQPPQAYVAPGQQTAARPR